MNKSLLAGILCTVAVSFVTLSAHASLIDRGDGLIYDDVLNITLLQDANLAASNTFGLTVGASLGTHPSDSSGVDGIVNPNGSMNWPGALHWIDAMNASVYKGFSDWRLPAMSPVNGSSFNTVPSSNATSDSGTASTTTDGTDGGWRDVAGNPVSEMGHMYYVNLANLGACDPGSPYCAPQPGLGLNSSSFVDGESGQIVSFDNVQPGVYWSGTELSSSSAWFFIFGNGVQSNVGKSFNYNAWAVRPGDVSALPVPAAVWLFGSGLLGLLGLARHKRR